MITATLDATPLLGPLTGIGRYTHELLAALTQRDDVAVGATAFTARGWRDLRTAVPAGVRTRATPVPARGLRSLWTRAEFPTVGALAGRSQVFHATNFVLPPTGRATGVLTVHDLAYLHHPGTVDRTARALVDLVPRGLRRAAAVCVPTAAVAGALQEAYRPLLPEVVVTPLGVDARWFQQPGAGPAPTGTTPYLLFVGTREPRKDLDTLLRAYALLRGERGADVPDLLLVGPSGWGPAQQPGPGVRVSGYLPLPELRDVVAGATALVMPSVDEGFGLPALEAMACGTPVVVSSAPALVEVTAGLAPVFPVGDAPELAAVLDAVVDRDPARGRAERIAHARAHTWERCAAATVQAYRIALG
ncbi:glycosyltransferase family 4 protein [Nakamurella leprariae]|uniref:Glycosyltransferase family 4 protein n=1 Tax=Nakamurella leprariae TaxID=2803911 RepID=A0A938YH45_9ACTN|nr:glycosyltransferase family 1 protein [Nakamurella leprariae]MBM9467705.1 glycosyltransferase family 4 protein [Nakamurella leprariae]